MECTNDMKNKLKPCPFCGRYELTFSPYIGFSGTVKMDCNYCHMHFEYEETSEEIICSDPYIPKIKLHTGHYLKTRPSFVEIWNSRANDDFT